MRQGHVIEALSKLQSNIYGCIEWLHSLKRCLTYETSLHMKVDVPRWGGHARRRKPVANKTRQKVCARHGLRQPIVNTSTTQQTPIETESALFVSLYLVSITHKISAPPRKNDRHKELVRGFGALSCSGWGFHIAVGFGFSPKFENGSVWGN